jgi:hypothetical protein
MLTHRAKPRWYLEPPDSSARIQPFGQINRNLVWEIGFNGVAWQGEPCVRPYENDVM